MIHSVQQMKFEMFAYIKEFGADFSQWYVGIAIDPKETLQAIHGLDLEADIWLYKQATSFKACRAVLIYFIEMLNVDGTIPSHGTKDMDCVFLYKKSARTRP